MSENTDPIVVELDTSGPYEVARNRVMPVAFISRYFDVQHYGGPEEGGWYYTVSHHEAVVAVFTDTTLGELWDRCRQLNEEAQAENAERSMSRYDRIAFSLEAFPAELDNSDEPRPHYE